MNNTTLLQGLFSIIICLQLLVSSSCAMNGLSISGSNELHFILTQVDDGYTDSIHRYFQNWASVSLHYKKIGIDLRYEAHLPPSPSSFNTQTRHDIAFRTITFDTEQIQIKAGHFYSMLGKGLTLRTYENRELGWDSKIDGLFFKFLSERFDLTILGGIPYAAHGQQYEPLEAGEISYLPHDILRIGGTMVVTNNPQQNTYWESLYFNVLLPFATVYTEYASKSIDNFFNPDTGKAIYVSASLFIKDFYLLAEGKYYRDYNLYEGMVYNSPPSVIKEHYFSLLNRKQLFIDADDEQGVFLEATYPIFEEIILTLSYAYSTTASSDHTKKYHDVFVQLEMHVPQRIHWILAADLQKENNTRHISFVVFPTWIIHDNLSLKLEFQHQHTALFDYENYKQIPKYYTQSYSLSLATNQNITFSVLGETTTNKYTSGDFKIGKNRIWLGGKITWNFLESHNLSAFAGTRRGGKNCAGGICKIEPPLKGLEVQLTSSF